MAAVTEKWNPHIKIRQDLFHFIDILAFNDFSVVAVQCTTTGHMADRRKKILGLSAAALWVENPMRTIWLIGWSKVGKKGARKLWEPKVEAITKVSFL